MAGAAEAPVGSFFDELRSAGRLRDLLMILAVPVVLLGVFSLSLEARQALAFSYTDPDIRTAFAANFVHLDVRHLGVNLAAYLLVVPTAYLLSVLSGRRDRFWFVCAFVTFLFVLPVLLSGLNLAIDRTGHVVGFSGIVMAFVGYLPVALSRYLGTYVGVGEHLDIAAVLFFAGLALIAILGAPSTVTAALAAVSVLAALLYLVPVLDGLERISRRTRTLVRVPGYLEVAIASVVLFVGLTVVAFPSDPRTAMGVVNLYAHLLGFAIGFIAAYVAVTASRHLSR